MSKPRQKLIVIEYRDGTVEYAEPNHIPMRNWTDYTVLVDKPKSKANALKTPGK